MILKYKKNDLNDYEIFNILNKEYKRQNNTINLIASENYASINVMKAQGSCLTNKYAEGYINKRYYSGCKYIDKIEEIAIKRAKKLFNVDYVNVQPHCGSQANFAVYLALLKPGDTLLGMNLKDGGHITHGSIFNFSGLIYKSISYNIDYKGNVNYSQIEYLAKHHKPKIIIGGFSSYSGLIDWKKIRFIADKINAYLLVDISHIAGLVITGLYPNPIPYAHVVTTTTHKTLGGPRGGLIISNIKDLNIYKKLDSAVFPGTQGGPFMNIIAAKAIAFKEALQPEFKLYQKQIIINAMIMIKIFLLRKFNVIFKKTYNHLFLIDLTNKKLTGQEASLILNNININVNKNIIPNDIKNFNITSGIRIGTISITKRKFCKYDIKYLSELICDALDNYKNKIMLNNIKKKVLSISLKYPIYK